MSLNPVAYVEHWDSREFPEFHERVVATGDGEVLRGHLAVAEAIVESWCADNPVLFVALIERWIDKARAADSGDRKFSQKWEERLSYNPKLWDALADGPAVVFERAGLTAFQARAVELMLDGKTATEIGVLLGIARQSAQDRIDKALEQILALDQIEEL